MDNYISKKKQKDDHKKERKDRKKKMQQIKKIKRLLAWSASLLVIAFFVITIGKNISNLQYSQSQGYSGHY